MIIVIADIEQILLGLTGWHRHSMVGKGMMLLLVQAKLLYEKS